jgi:tRNA(Ile)-lysidine synthase
MDSIKLSENESRISWRAIAPYSDSVLRELFIRLLRKWKLNTRGIDSEKLFNITARLRESGNFSIALGGGLLFFREYDNCGFSEKRIESHRFSEDARVFKWDDPTVPLIIIIDANKKISLQVENVERPDPQTLEEAEEREMAFFDMERVLFPLTVRFARPGDVFVPLGSKKPKKVARFCIDQKIPYQQRKDLLLLLDKKNDIIWCIGIRISDSVRITSDTHRFIRIAKCTSLTKELEGRERKIPHSFDGKE